MEHPEASAPRTAPSRGRLGVPGRRVTSAKVTRWGGGGLRVRCAGGTAGPRAGAGTESCAAMSTCPAPRPGADKLLHSPWLPGDAAASASRGESCVSRKGDQALPTTSLPAQSSAQAQRQLSGARRGCRNRKERRDEGGTCARVPRSAPAHSAGLFLPRSPGPEPSFVQSFRFETNSSVRSSPVPSTPSSRT